MAGGSETLGRLACMHALSATDNAHAIPRRELFPPLK